MTGAQISKNSIPFYWLKKYCLGQFSFYLIISTQRFNQPSYKSKCEKNSDCGPTNDWCIYLKEFNNFLLEIIFSQKLVVNLLGVPYVNCFLVQAQVDQMTLVAFYKKQLFKYSGESELLHHSSWLPNTFRKVSACTVLLNESGTVGITKFD